MQLTQYSDFALRTLLHLAVSKESNISEVAAAYNISRNHLVKVVHHLGKVGLIESQRGRGGGIRLARSAETVTIAEVVRLCEPHFHLVECFDAQNNRCVISPVCRLQGVLGEARAAFFSVLERYTLQDVVQDPESLALLLGIKKPPVETTAG
ncbi:MAG: Rrf2 family transcriptional regulator [Candidatus Hydrogenedens sp.]|nr:Rrf2 family transcriptional regulator [Candidatus Hydrogenedens sp.]